MSDELKFSAATGSTYYARVYDSDGDVWNTSSLAFENWNVANVTDYDIPLTDESSGLYLGDFPTGIAEGTYTVIVYLQSGASPATGDAVASDPGTIIWDGTAEVPQASQDDVTEEDTVSSYGVYIRIRNEDDEVWYPTGGAFEAWNDSNQAAYGISCTDQSGNLHTVTFPAAVPAGTYLITAHLEVGTQSGDDPMISAGVWVWTGTEGRTPGEDAIKERFKNVLNVYDDRGTVSLGGVYPVLTKETGGVYP